MSETTTYICDTCGKTTIIPQGWYHVTRYTPPSRAWPDQHFCSRACAGQAFTTPAPRPGTRADTLAEVTAVEDQQGQ